MAQDETLAALYAAMEVAMPPSEGKGEEGVFVPGEGPLRATLALVGERPGDREDREGRPFVGPAGAMLDACLAAARLKRGELFLTNAVKRFRFVLTGKRRLHQAPNAGEISHGRWWLARELDLVAPRLVVTLGATALRAVTGVRVLGPLRGKVMAAENRRVVPTVHPSFLLRLRDEADREREREAFIADLAMAKRLAAGD